MLAAVCFVLLQLVVLASSGKNRPSPHSLFVHQCSVTIFHCRQGVHYRSCLNEHGCPILTDLTSVDENCRVATLECESALNECIDALGPDGCTKGDTPPTPTPVPKHHKTPTPLSISKDGCQEMEDQCKTSAQYVSCRENMGCTHPDDSTTETCAMASKACADVLKNCVKFFGPPECSSM